MFQWGSEGKHLADQIEEKLMPPPVTRQQGFTAIYAVTMKVELLQDVLALIEDAPTIFEIVRCENCAHYHPCSKEEGHCKRLEDKFIMSHDFCAWAEKKR